MSKTIVIGAGITGLTTAYALQKAGRETVVLERSHEVGGLSRSVDLDGFIFDLGPHYFFLKFDPRADLLVKECLGERARVLDFQVSAVIRGRNLAWPPSLKGLIHLPFSSMLTFLRNSLRRRFPKDRDCEGFMSQLYGPAIFREFIGPYIQKKVPQLGPQGLHREWWLQVTRNIHNQYKGMAEDEIKKIEHQKRVSLLTRCRVLFNLIRGLIITAMGKQLSKVLYPHGGMGSLSKGLAARYEEAGGRIRLNAQGVKLECSENRIRSVACDGFQCDDPGTVVWTGSIHELAAQLGMEKPDLPFIRIHLGFIKIKKPLSLPAYLYTYYSEPDIIFNRAYFPSLIMKELVPPGKDAVCVEISPRDGPDAPPADEKTLEESIIAGLEKASICKKEDIEEITIKEVPAAYPVYPLNYYETLQNLWEQLRPFENLWSVGRSGQFYYNNMARAMSQGLDLAEHLLGKEKETGVKRQETE